MAVQVGDFCVVPISGPVGTLISVGEWFNGQGFTNYDHAEIYVGNPTYSYKMEYGFTLGAYPGGARLKPLECPPDQLPNALWSSDAIPLTQEQRDAIVSYALRLQGTPYSSLDYFALAAHRLHLPIPWLKNYVASTKHMICSQLVDWVYCEAGIHLFQDNRWPGYVTPADLAKRILGQEKS